VVTGENDGQCRTGFNLHRWGVREGREEMEVRTCTDRNNCRRQKAILIAATPRAALFVMLNLRGSYAAGGAGGCRARPMVCRLSLATGAWRATTGKAGGCLAVWDSSKIARGTVGDPRIVCFKSAASRLRAKSVRNPESQ
jgi:hypothetical protein